MPLFTAGQKIDLYRAGHLKSSKTDDVTKKNVAAAASCMGLFVLTAREFDREKSIPKSISFAAAHEGRLLYD